LYSIAAVEGLGQLDDREVAADAAAASLIKVDARFE